MVSEVILGFPAADGAGPPPNFCEVTQSWLGGNAVWAGEKTDALETKIKGFFCCRLCSNGMPLVLQLYCPCDSSTDRVLYIFVCTNKQSVKSAHANKTSVIRCASSPLGWRAVRRVTARQSKVHCPVASTDAFPAPAISRGIVSESKVGDKAPDAAGGLLGGGAGDGIDWAGILCDAHNADLAVQQQKQDAKALEALESANCGFIISGCTPCLTPRFESIWLEAAVEATAKITNNATERKLDGAAAAALERYTEEYGAVHSVDSSLSHATGETEEKYEKIGTADDVTFERFHKVFNANPYQVLRNCFGGEPLWLYSQLKRDQRAVGASARSPSFAVGGAVQCAPTPCSGGTTLETDHTHDYCSGYTRGLNPDVCMTCKSERAFELQLMPSIFIELERKLESLPQQEWAACKDFMLWWSGVVVVYTCRNDCASAIEGTEEYVDIQLGI